MKYILLTGLLLFIYSFPGNCQDQADNQIPGTHFILLPPSEFKYDKDIPGFVSELDSSIISISEIKNPYSFDILIEKRITNILSLGIDTSNLKESVYDGYRSVEFMTNSTDHQRLFMLSFGSDDFLVDISIMTSNTRLEELKQIVLKGKYNKDLTIETDSHLGFTVSFEGTHLNIFKKDANTLNTKEKDENENVVSWLNLTRMPKSFYEGSSLDEAIEATYQLYRFDKEFVRRDTLMVDNSNFLSNVYTEDHTTYKEYTVIGIIQKEDFYLLVMGGAGNQDKLEDIFNVVRSIKFKNNQ